MVVRLWNNGIQKFVHLVHRSKAKRAEISNLPEIWLKFVP